MFRNHVALRTKLYVPQRRLPLNYINVQRRMNTSIDVLHEAHIDDCCIIDGDKSLSELWIGFTRLELHNTYPPEGHMWVPGRQTKKHVTTRPGIFGVERAAW